MSLPFGQNPPFGLWKALANYRTERHRLKAGPFPHVACNCAFCDTVRAADLLYQCVTEETRHRWSLEVLLPLPGDGRMN